VLLSYVLSFLYLAIYWDNHHHFFHLVRRVDGMMLWANLHLAFVDIRVAGATYLLVALLWLIPDRRIERVLYRS
ncbi:MAG TPA: TMEM175 family protein, partial [Acetobacteraceae bacterium]|nr:TMEM175 family protein [Acetobacteraceae bacterium]